MSNNADSRLPSAAVPDVEVEKRHGVPLVWLIPVLAAAIAAWLAYTTYAKQGPTITITFESAAGLEPGKTQIKYRDVAVGVVNTVTLADDLSHVIVSAQMAKAATEHLREGTQFWVENARVTAAGVSGLGTLVSGAYIGVLPGPGKPARNFQGTEQPPVLQVSVPGHKFTLRAEKLGSLSANSPIYYRGIQVGEVLGSTLNLDAKDVSIFAFVHAPYDALVRSQTRFWNAGGVDMSIGASGLKVRTESLVALLVGGIAFDTPVEASSGKPSEDGAQFPLYASYDSIEEAGYTQKVPYLLYFQESVGGLLPGAPVTFHGMQLGVVESVRLEIDVSNYSVRIPVVIQVQPQRASVVGESKEQTPQGRMERFVERGLRAQLRSGSLLTGALVVALDFFPQEPPLKLTHAGEFAVIPTVPSQVEQLTEKATTFLTKLADAPVAQLVADLRNTVKTVDTLLAAPALRQGVDGLREIGPVLDSVKQTSDSAKAALVSADGAIGSESALRYDLARMLQELTSMARSVRTLTDYLENHPNALIFGKSSSGDQ
jgi:paraquat-inducible protein B